MSLKVKLVGEDIVIGTLVREDTTAGGLVIPDSAQNTSNMIEVLFSDEDTGIEPGAKVVFDPREASTTKIQGTEVVVFRVSDALICVLE